MLDRLLQMLQGGGTFTVAELARRLNTTTPLIEMMLEDLTRLGYLSAASAACGKRCESCSLGPCAIVGGSGQVWSWTGKGET